jgi:amidase
MPELDHEKYFRDYTTLLIMITSSGTPKAEREARVRELAEADDPFSDAERRGLTLDAVGLLQLLARREAARAAWRAFFKEWDVLVCPAALDVAFPHQTGPQSERVLEIDGHNVPYMGNLVYPMWAIFAGQPATAFPAGLSEAGLPVGLQAIGPYLEDRTTLRFAQLLEREWHAFEPPSGY